MYHKMEQTAAKKTKKKNKSNQIQGFTVTHVSTAKKHTGLDVSKQNRRRFCNSW